MPHLLKRVVVTIAGGALVLLGIVLLPLPGPGFLVIAAGLGLLATEYTWARNLLNKTRDRAMAAQREAVKSPARALLTVVFGLGMVGVGIVEIVVPSIPFRSITAGIFIILGGLILIATTAIAWRSRDQEHGQEHGQERTSPTSRAPGTSVRVEQAGPRNTARAQNTADVR